MRLVERLVTIGALVITGGVLLITERQAQAAGRAVLCQDALQRKWKESDGLVQIWENDRRVKPETRRVITEELAKYCG